MKHISILYQDNDLCVINKPAGIVVNRAESVKVETIQDWAEEKFQEKFKQKNAESDFYKRNGVVHRLETQLQ